MHTWILEIVLVCELCMCMCVSMCPPPRLLITSGVIWPPYDCLNKVYSIYMAAVVIVGSRCGLKIEARHGN